MVLSLGAVAYGAVTRDGYDQLVAVQPECAGRFSGDTPASFDTEGINAEFTAGGFDTGPYAMPAYEEVGFPSRDTREPRVTIRAWWVPAPEPGAPAVILVHGRDSCRRDPVVLLPAGMLARNGFSVLMIDMRDQGDSDIEDGRSGWGSEEYLDILGAWDWLQSAKGLPASRIGLVGESLGASSAIIAMGEEPAIAATWADSGFADLGVLFDERIAREGYPTWLRPGVVAWAWISANDDLLSRRPLDEVGKIAARPLAVVHGLADDELDVHHAKDLAIAHATFVPGYEPWLVPRAPHLQAAFAEPAEYERRIVEFFRTSLDPGG
jgi:dipeptidyl aminopeptidase/acylaminoacyl peptidase